MTPEQTENLKELFSLAVKAAEATQLVRRFNGGEPTPPLMELRVYALHKRALADLEAGTFDWDAFNKEIISFSEAGPPDLTKGGFISPPAGEGGVFVTPVKPT